MLILTRKTEEAIIIGDNIRLVILDSGKGYVKIGIDAPKEITVHREEIYNLITTGSRKIIKPRTNSVLRSEVWKK